MEQTHKAAIQNLLNNEVIELKDDGSNFSFPQQTTPTQSKKRNVDKINDNSTTKKKKKLKWTDETNFTIKSQSFTQKLYQIPQKI